MAQLTVDEAIEHMQEGGAWGWRDTDIPMEPQLSIEELRAHYVPVTLVNDDGDLFVMWELRTH